jgi:hypothetical protein
MKIFNFGKDIYGTLDSKNLDPSDPSMIKGNHNEKQEKSNEFENRPLGTVNYYPNKDPQTNHRWEWTLTADEVEYLTRGKAADEPVTVTRWIRYQAKTFQEANKGIDPDERLVNTEDQFNAPYPYIWIKLTMTITRDALTAKYTKKWDNMWYHFNTGADNGWSSYIVDIEAPRDNKTIYKQNWYGIISHTLETNVPVLTKFADGTTALDKKNQTGWYYFAPKTYQITGVSGRKYTITPQRSGKIGTNVKNDNNVEGYRDADVNWNKLYNKYIVKGNKFEKTPGTKDKNADLFEATVDKDASYDWSEKDLEALLTKYAIDLKKGAFTNDTLYAYWEDAKGKNGYYTPIAAIKTQKFNMTGTQTVQNNEEAGEIVLFHWLEEAKTGKGTETPQTDDQKKENWVCYDILNAIGYAENNANVEKQLRGWLGFVGAECEDKVAFYVEQAQYDGENKATVLSSWERPINMPVKNPDDAIDAKTNENYVYMVDCLKMFDWRGEKQGYMYNDQYWFWAYYNINGVAVVTDPNLVQIKINDETEWKKLSEITNYLRLEPLTATTFTGTVGNAWPYGTTDLYPMLKNAAYYDFSKLSPALTTYNAAGKESAIEAVLGVNPTVNANKAKFGGFYYENDALNITKFTLKIPVGIRYEWGWLYTEDFYWRVDTTVGN